MQKTILLLALLTLVVLSACSQTTRYTQIESVEKCDIQKANIEKVNMECSVCKYNDIWKFYLECVEK